MIRKFLLVLVLTTTAAWAREPDSVLGLIQVPNDGRPVIARPGGAFEAVLSERAVLRITGRASSHELTVVWDPSADGRMKALCTVPADAPPGTYVVEAVAGDKVDQTVRSVYLRESFPDYYAIAHLTDIQIGSDRRARSAEAVFADLIQAVNASSAAFVLITGDLTEDGGPDAFRKLIAILDQCTKPTFVCPGERDTREGGHETFFGPPTYMFWFGRDGYLSFDTGGAAVDAGLGRHVADLHVFRRAIRPARWSIGFTYEYNPAWDMRGQIVLFVDDPLDHLFVGHEYPGNGEKEVQVPWGTTVFTATPAGMDGAMRFIDVSPGAVRPREPEYVVELNK
jgi:hypothetical protein